MFSRYFTHLYFKIKNKFLTEITHIYEADYSADSVEKDKCKELIINICPHQS